MASVRRCIDCEVVLVDETSPSGAIESTAAPVGEGDRVSYELDGWGNQLKVSLEGMLDKAGILRVWEVGALIVSADDTDTVDSLIATVEGRDVEDLVEMEEQLAFEIEGLDAEGAAELDARLIAAGIVHAWSEEGELLVALDDEDRVTEIVEAVVEGEVDGEVDGLAANQALSDLFLALDRLMRAPDDQKLIGRFAAAAEPLGPMGVPYGFAAQEWTDLQAEVAALVTHLDDTDDDTDDEGADADAGADADDGPEAGDEALSAGERFLVAADALRERLLTWV